MAFEEHKERKQRTRYSFADYEYVSKRSRQPWRGLVLMIFFALLLWWFAWDRWHEMAAAEETGATISMSPIEWGLYKIGGKIILSGFFALMGALLVCLGIYNYKRLEKMKAN